MEEELLVYYALPEPPWAAIVIGILISISCGLAFQRMLKIKVSEWLRDNNIEAIQRLSAPELIFPFAGMCLGILLFLTMGLQIFAVAPWIAFTVSMVITLLVAFLLWYQLKQLLIQLYNEGSAGLDLDGI